MPRMAAEAGCAAMAGTAAATAAGTGPAETGATCVFGGASAAAQASVAAARMNARAIFFVFLEPARAVRGPLMPGDVYDVYAMTRRSLLRSRTEEFQPRCRESDRHEQQAAKSHSAALRRLYLSSDGASQLQTLNKCGLSRTGHSQDTPR